MEVCDGGYYIADEIVLTHHQNVFSIEYVGVSMTHADKHTYAFQL